MEVKHDIIQKIEDMSAESVAYIQASRFGSHAKYQSLEDVWRMARRRWMGDHWDTTPRRGLRSYVVNRNQTAIASQTANQLGASGIRTQIEPVESNDIPVFAIAPEAGRRLMVLMASDPQISEILENDMGLSEEHLLGEMSISKEISEALINATVSAGVDPETLVPIAPMIPPETFDDAGIVELNDALFAKIVNDTYQTKFDLARGNFYAFESEIKSNNYGHQAIVFQWDEEKRNFEFRTPSPFAILPDPSGSCVEEMQWVIFDQVKTIDEAMADYPEKKEEIENSKQSGAAVKLRGTTSGGYYEPEGSFGGNDVPKVVIRTVWMRNHKYDMEETEVIDAGWAERNDGVGEDGVEFLTITREGEAEGLGGSGEPLIKGDSNWPKVNGIRQIQIIEDRNVILSDIRCPFWDIPIAWNKNFPLLDGPFGISEHARLEDIQSMINRVISMVYNLLNYNQCPQQVLSSSMAESLKDFGTALHAHPNRIAIINDAAWQQLASTGFKGMFVDPPAVPSSWVNILNMLFNEHDLLSGNNNVVQGRAPFSGASGRTVEALQSAALGVLNLRSLNTQWSFERLARLGADSMIKFMPPSEWRKFASKYPPVVFKLMRDRIKRLEYDIKVVVQAGRGMSKQMDRENAIQEYQTGLATLEQTLEKLGVENPKASAREIRKEQQMGIVAKESLDQRASEG